MIGTGLVLEFRCQNQIAQVFTEDQKRLGLVDENGVYPLRSCGARVLSKTFHADVNCPRCGARYHVGGPNRVTRLPQVGSQEN